MVSYLYQAPAGIPGDIVNVDETSVEPAMLVQSGSPLAFPQAWGIPMVYAAGGITQYQTSNVAADFAGVLIREVPSIAGAGDLGQFSPTIPNSAVPNGLAVRGYVSVACTVGTPARGGVVYIRTVAAGGKAIGDFEAVSDPGNNVALSATQAEWATDGKDAFNNTTLRIAR